MNITVKDLVELHPAQKNIRNHTPKQITEYKKSIDMFGQIRPLVVDENGEIIAGNGLFIAMKEMGLETADCYIMSGLSKKQKTKLMMADNKIYELGITDSHVLEDIVADLEKDFEVPGWDAEILSILDATQQDIDDMIDDLVIDEPVIKEDETIERIDQYQSAGKERVYEGSHTELQSEVKPQVHKSPEVERTEKYIICPRCGEKICL